MANMKIPDGVVQALEKLKGLDAASSEMLLEAINDSEPSLNLAHFIDSLAAKISSIDYQTINEIIRALVSLHSYRASKYLSSEQIIENILSSKDATKFSSDTNIGQLGKTLKEYLDAESLRFTSKALVMFVDHSHVFQGAQVITDIRPLFKDDVVDDLMGGMVFHTLKIAHRNEGKLTEFTVALDRNDIKELRKCLDRAELKEQQLKKVFENVKIPYVEVADES